MLIVKRTALALCLFVVLVAPIMLLAQSNSEASAQTVPSVPEFTVKFVDKSYDVPASTSTDPYTGKTVTNPSYHVENRTIEIAIKNQPFPSDLYYNIRVKGHFAENWSWLYGWEGSPKMSDSEYTLIVFSSSGAEDFRGPNGIEVYAPSGGQVDFQVEAFVGGSELSDITPGVPPIGGVWHFAIQSESGWSSTQTLTLPASSTPEIPEFPSWIILPLPIIVLISVGLMVYFKKRKHQAELK